jgi:hypothetical protein
MLLTTHIVVLVYVVGFEPTQPKPLGYSQLISPRIARTLYGGHGRTRTYTVLLDAGGLQPLELKPVLSMPILCLASHGGLEPQS